MMWAAIVFLVGQGVVIGLLIRFVRTFGAFAAAATKAHESNAILYLQAIKILEYAHHLLQEEKSA